MGERVSTVCRAGPLPGRLGCRSRRMPQGYVNAERQRKQMANPTKGSTSSMPGTNAICSTTLGRQHPLQAECGPADDAHLNRRTKKPPRCIIIAGPNGSGKTTFATQFLPKDAGIVDFVNADLIASGLSPLKPELASRAAARLVLAELDRLARARADFAFESTLSGVSYAGASSGGRPQAIASSSCIAVVIASASTAPRSRTGEARRPRRTSGGPAGALLPGGG